MALPYSDEDLGHGEVDSARLLRESVVPWDIYYTARLISDRAVQLLRRYDKKDSDYQAKLLEEAGPAYVEAFLTVLKNVTKDETVHYVLALLDEMLAVDPARAAFFHATPGTAPGAPLDVYAILLRLLQRNDWFTQEKACLLLTAALGSRPGKEGLVTAAAAAEGGANGASSSGATAAAVADPVQQTMVSFLDWLCGQLRRPTSTTRSVPTAVHSLSRLLREPPVRAMLHRAGGVPLLAPLVGLPATSGGINIQLLYEATLCVWQLSFYRPAADALCGATSVVGGLVDMVRGAQKEKLVRVALMALKNLISVGPLSLEFAVVEKGLPKAVANRTLQSWDDNDIPQLLEWMGDHLAEGIAGISSFERYKAELLTGTLTWAPLHEDDVFWRDHSAKLVEANCQLLRVLLKLLESSRDSTSLAVGCRDLAQFVTYYPHGRGIVSELRGKELVMRLMMHPDPQVQSEALKCVQKILLSKDKADFLSVGA